MEAILEKVATVQVAAGEPGRVTDGGGDDQRIATPILQLVMTRLWKAMPARTDAAGYRWLRLETLDQLGGAERIVETHLDEAMANLTPARQQIASLIFQHLVTRSRTKIAYPVLDLAEEYNLRPKQIVTVLDKLSSGETRILRPVAPPLEQPGLLRYEIFHDVLAAAVLDWRTRYNEQRRRIEAESQLEQEREEARQKSALQQKELEQAKALAEEQQRRGDEQIKAAWTLSQLLMTALAAQKAAAEQARLAKKRLKDLEKVISEVPGKARRQALTKRYLPDSIKRLTKSEEKRLEAKLKAPKTPGKAHGRNLSGLKLWENGATLRVQLQGGTQAQHEIVQRAAQEWMKYANLKFEFGTAADAEIRISFDPNNGSWAYISTDALAVPAGHPTMNLAWVYPYNVLHEFGHVLGLIHETNNPNANLPWNKEAVYRDLSGPPNSWSKQEIDAVMFQKQQGIQYRKFDPDSIMMYENPARWFRDNRARGGGKVLSAADKQFVRKLYPPD